MAIELGLIGASGKLGRAIAALALADPAFVLKATYGRGAPDLCSVSVDLYIDASLPEALPRNLEAALQTETPIVVGVTGLTQEHRALLERAAKNIPLFYTPNFSLGIALLRKWAAEAALLFHFDADVDLIEAHHTEKKDAPSGSALALAKAIEQHRPAPRIHSIRSGALLGEHTLRFNTAEEELQMGHRVHSREAFARGALRAARFLVGKPAGLYGMEHLMSEKQPN